MENKNYAIMISAIVSAFLLLSVDIEYAFADTTITIITPTGGALGATSDCNDITSGNGIIWHACNNVIYAISDTTNTVSASISVTVGTSDSFLASVSGTSLYHRAGGTNDIRKYTYSGSTISLSGIYTPPCTLGAELQYDELGYLWTVCGTQDQVLRINPNTLTTAFVSQALDDNVGIDCDSPTRVSYSASDGIGVIRCSVAPQGIVTFSIASPTSANLLDDELNANIGNNNVFVHERYNRIIAVDATELEVYSYTAGGIISAQEKVITSTYDGCGIEPYITSDVMTVCIDDSGTNVLIYGFVSNSTQVFQLLNTVQAMDNTNGDKTLGFDIQDRTWFITSNTNDQRYIKISGLAGTSGTPDPPIPPDDNDTGGNAINGTCQNTDANGDGISGGVLDCVGNTGGLTSITGGRPVLNTTNDFCQGLGLCDQDNDDPQTNGSGLILMLLMGSFFAIVLMNGARKTGFSLSDIPKEMWLFLVIAVVGFAFYVNWIPDLVFYGLCVGLAGLFAFGLYKHIGSRG